MSGCKGYCDELAEVDYGVKICLLCELECDKALETLGRNLSVAGGLELARRYGRWDREGFWRDNP